MNSKRAKVLRKVAKHLHGLGIYLPEVTERRVYQHTKKADKKLNTCTKEIFSVTEIRSTLP